MATDKDLLHVKTYTFFSHWLFFLLGTFAQSTFAKTVQITDLAGRTVQVPANPQRIILGESRYLFALSILDRENPLQRVVGMLADLKEIDPDSYRQYQKQFPKN